MNLEIHIPDKIREQLQREWPDFRRRVSEAIAVQASFGRFES